MRCPTPSPSRPDHLGRGRRLVLPALLALSFGFGARGQNAPARRPLLLKIVPQHLVTSGLWLEVEHGWGRQPRQTFTFTPQFYAGPAGHPNSATPDYQVAPEAKRTVRGAGLQVMYRRYWQSEPGAPAAGPYVSYGATFQRFAISYNGSGWQEVLNPNGLPYYEYRSASHAETTTRYGLTSQAGYQLPLGSRFVLDVYAGLGWRTGQSRVEAGRIRSQYRTGTSDYGHLGWYFPAGFKIGVAL